jgi:two-component system cell cycle sensor histidine kinase/response regulator CckA
MIETASILVIDDDPGTCQTVGDVLELRGHAVSTATRGQAALAALAGSAVNVALLDIQLPDISGLDLLRSIKTSSPSTEVIIITGHASVPTAIQAINGTAFAYLTKPFEMNHLLSLVDKALEKQRLERALRESEERYRLVADHIQDAILLLDLEGRLVFTNRRGEELTGYFGSEYRNLPLASILTPEGGAEAARRIDAARSGRDVDPFFETELVRRDGSRIWVEANIANFLKDGQLVGRMAVVRDIGARKRAEVALRKSSQTLQTLIDAAPVTIFALDENERTTLWNKAAERLWGWRADEVLGQPVTMVPDHTRAEFEDSLARNRRGESTLTETQWQQRDGTIRDVLVSRAPIVDTEGRVVGTMGVVVDITALKHLEEQLRQAVKMEGIGRLAGGIAHDFNNLLTVIGGRTYLLLGQLPAGHPMRRDVQLIEETGSRAAALTRQLLAFSRNQILAPVVLDVNEVVSGMESLLQRLLGEDVNLRIALDPLVCRVTADPGQLEQVMVNLAVNARDAMPAGGRLTIETSNVVVDQAYAQQHVDVGPGLYVVLTVSDSGTGMDAATTARIFEPFFTTKEAGKGTGLGLSTAYGIIKQSNGHITVYSEPGRGTTFRIYLPRTDADLDAASTHLDVAPRGSETVLLVEDDANIRELARELLELSGYTVFESRDVQDAVRIAERYSGVIDLLITDVVMPEMGGRAVAESVKNLRPDIKVLYMSGYTDEAVVRHGVLNPGTAFLQKPFTPGTLARKVREVLG